jgi:cyclopropane fatty-acyl-phospholipid synthase-like methyltransferase
MNNNVFNKISTYYDKLVAAYGHDPKSCDYGQSVSQIAKFNILSSCIDYSDKSVLDIGCGFADYYDFLSAKYQHVNYHGVDISVSMISKAKELHPNLQLEVRNVFENAPENKYDVVTANGVFYLLGENAWPLMCEFIKKMYDMSEQVVAFNTLSTWTSDKESSEFYADPEKVLAFCKTISSWVAIRHDYHSRDFSVFIYKNKNYESIH